MKKTYAIMIGKSDGTKVHKHVLAAAGENEPAIVVATRAAVAACEAGDELLGVNNVNPGAAVDIDATVQA